MSVISVRVDDDVKASAQEVAASLGLSLSAIINAYLRQVSATRRVEFYAPEPMTEKLEGLIGEIEAEIQAGAVSKKFDSVDEFLTELKK